MNKWDNINRFAPWFRAPVHGVYFGQVASECSSGTHLNATNRLHWTCSLGQGCVTGCFTSILLRLFWNRSKNSRNSNGMKYTNSLFNYYLSLWFTILINSNGINSLIITFLQGIFINILIKFLMLFILL